MFYQPHRDIGFLSSLIPRAPPEALFKGWATLRWVLAPDYTLLFIFKQFTFEFTLKLLAECSWSPIPQDMILETSKRCRKRPLNVVLLKQYGSTKALAPLLFSKPQLFIQKIRLVSLGNKERFSLNKASKEVLQKKGLDKRESSNWVKKPQISTDFRNWTLYTQNMDNSTYTDEWLE